jgi:hypothetical protein
LRFVLVVASAIVLSVAGAACSGSSVQSIPLLCSIERQLGVPEAPAGSQTADAQVARGQDACDAPSHWDRGMNFVGFDRKAFEAGARNGAVAAARNQLGLRTAILVPHWYTRTGRSSNVFEHWKTPSLRGLAQLARHTRGRLGMKTIIKPHVDSLDGTWRGHMRFPNRRAFWHDYMRLMVRYAKVAQRSKANGLVIGTELSVVEAQQPRKWLRLIARVRNNFDGLLYYATNWDRLQYVESLPAWFGKLDVIGVDFYDDNANLSSRQIWRNMVDLHRRFDMPVVLSESGASNREDQLNHYRQVSRAMRAGLDERWFHGIWWYDRFTFSKGGYGKTWDDFTPNKATSKWLCRQHTARPDRYCNRLINRVW